MDDWKSLIDQAMQIETTDTIGAHQIYESAVRATWLIHKCCWATSKPQRSSRPFTERWWRTLKR